MKRKLIKAAALGLSFLVASAFCACGEHGKDDSVDEDGKVSVSVFRYDLTSLSTALRNKTSVSTTITGKFNMDITVKTAPSSNWEETLNTLISTNRIPDMFVCYGPDRPVQYKKWVEQDILLPVSDYVSETKYPHIYARLQNYNQFLNLDYTNGKHYAIPILSSDCDHCLYIRTDWLKAVNAKEKVPGEPNFTEDGNRFHLTGPETMTEF